MHDKTKILRLEAKVQRLKDELRLYLPPPASTMIKIQAPPGLPYTYKTRSLSYQVLTYLQRNMEEEPVDMRVVHLPGIAKSKLMRALYRLVKQGWILALGNGVFRWSPPVMAWRRKRRDPTCEKVRKSLNEETLYPIWSSGVCIGYLLQVDGEYVIHGRPETYTTKKEAVTALRASQGGEL